MLWFLVIIHLASHHVIKTIGPLTLDDCNARKAHIAQTETTIYGECMPEKSGDDSK